MLLNAFFYIKTIPQKFQGLNFSKKEKQRAASSCTTYPPKLGLPAPPKEKPLGGSDLKEYPTSNRHGSKPSEMAQHTPKAAHDIFEIPDS